VKCTQEKGITPKEKMMLCTDMITKLLPQAVEQIGLNFEV